MYDAPHHTGFVHRNPWLPDSEVPQQVVDLMDPMTDLLRYVRSQHVSNHRVLEAAQQRLLCLMHTKKSNLDTR